jgi:4-hydroxythreonine-4-phosphate dehydrogenase
MTNPRISRPRIAITMGDPSGIGPEIIVKALASGVLDGLCDSIVVGDVGRLEDAARRLGLVLRFRAVSDARAPAQGFVPVIAVGSLPADHPYGAVSAAGGEMAYRAVEKAVALASAGAVDAICTAPLSKEAMHAAGYRYPGHTELIAELTGAKEVSMMLVSPKLRVVHVTTHIGLVQAIAKIEPGLVFRTIERGRAAILKALDREPRIGVCGINPHAGENGLFGNGEEAEKIDPAVAKARAKGWLVEGPLAADTLFFRAVRGDFDLVVAMYHDQGHAPIKVLGLEEGVNVSVGLPVIRTSVDHGTAFDIAGKGIADERSLVAAMREAVILAGAKAEAAEVA